MEISGVIPHKTNNGIEPFNAPHAICFKIYSLWSVKLATLFSVTGGNFSVIHVDYMDFVPELGWRFQSRNLWMRIKNKWPK